MQKAVYWDDRRFLCLVAGRGTGKTTSACMRILGMIQRNEIPTGGRILIIAPDYPQLKDGTLKSFDKWFGPDGADIIEHMVNGNAPFRKLAGNIEVLFRSAMNPDQTRSKECCLVWLDEAAQMDEQMLTLTNANLRQFGNNASYQTIITTTPRGKNWIYRRFGEHLMNSDNDDPMVGAYRTTTMEAYREGVVRSGYIEEIGYTPGSEMWRQELEAEFVSWSGLVFRQGWKKLDIKPALRYVVGGVDVGSISPSCILLVGVDEPGNFYAFKQFYKPKTDTHELAKLIGEWHKEFGVNKWVIDDADLWRNLRNAGLPTAPPNKKHDAAESSINYINSLISRGMFHIDEHECDPLVKEMSTYEYKDKTSGDDVTFLDKVKQNQADHAIDALRYATRVLSAYKSYNTAGWGRIGFGVGRAS